MKISEMLIAVASWLESPENEALLLAEHDDACLELTAETCLRAAMILKEGAVELDKIEPEIMEPVITSESLDSLADFATALDMSDDEELKKHASVIDELLLTIAAPADSVSQAKKKADNRIEELTKKYQDPKKFQDENIKAADAVKAIEKSPYMKAVRPLEQPLSARTCPEHPGAGLARVGDCVWQCSLNGKLFDFASGFTLPDGRIVPGGDVANQSKTVTYGESHSMFDSRESRLNNNQN